MTRMPARKFLSALLLLLTLCMLLASGANAVQPDEVLPDPAARGPVRAFLLGRVLLGEPHILILADGAGDPELGQR